MKKNQTAFVKLCLADALIRLMQERPWAEIGVSEVCELSGVGRTTFYRHCDCKGSMDELLLFKLCYDWERYELLHREEAECDIGCTLLRYIYESRELVLLMYRNGLEGALRRAFERLTAAAVPAGGNDYLRSFYSYGYFGVICRWIERGFDDSPEQLCGYVREAIGGGCKKANESADGGIS